MTIPDAKADPGQTYPWLAAYPPGVDWACRLDGTALFDLMDQAAARSPNKICTNFIGRTTTYEETSRQVNRAAAALQHLGVTRGTKVGLLLPNCPAYVVYYYAILKAGGTVVNFNPLYTIDELTFQVRDSETELMIALDLKLLFDKVERLLDAGVLKGALICSFTNMLPPAKAILYRLFKAGDLARPSASPCRSRITLEHDFAALPSAPTPLTIDPEADVAVLQYTGGTTGTPKGAMLTHANITINVQQVQAWAPTLVYGEERVLAVLPFFHVFAMTLVMNYAVAMASEMVIMPRFILDEALALIDKTRPTVMPGVPTLFNAILNHPKVANHDLSCLKFCLSGGAPLPVEVKQRFEAITKCVVVEGYGLSEASPVVTCNPLVGTARVGSIGQPLPGTIISLRDLADPMQEVPPGERGEICIKGPQVMRGYWKKPAETAAQFAGPYLRTGDVGVMDEDGFIYIVDRIKDLIICSGYNVYPRRIEEALYEHKAVEECIVIGVPDKYRGEAPKAFIKLRAGETATSEAIQAHLGQKLSRIELPAAIEFRTTLPKTMIGKLSKKELKAEEANRRKG